MEPDFDYTNIDEVILKVTNGKYSATMLDKNNYRIDRLWKKLAVQTKMEIVYNIAAVYKNGHYTKHEFKSAVNWAEKELGIKKSTVYSYIRVGQFITYDKDENGKKRYHTVFEKDGADFTTAQLDKCLPLRDYMLIAINSGEITPDMKCREIQKYVKIKKQELKAMTEKDIGNNANIISESELESYLDSDDGDSCCEDVDAKDDDAKGKYQKNILEGNKHRSLSRARSEKNGEFFTRFEDIEAEIFCYDTSIFKNKTVLCNCNDGKDSNFYKFFRANFEHFGLWRLICTSYTSNETNEEGIYNKAVVREHYMRKGKLIYARYELDGCGDFMSDEMIQLMGEADIVVTNPPFAMFRQFIELVTQMHKKFIVLGNLNAAACNGIFKLIKDGDVWFGANTSGGKMRFRVYEEDDTGLITEAYTELNNIRWYTNIKHERMPEALELYECNDGQFSRYDEYDAINVDKVRSIPDNYFGEIGVPITFLDKYNPEQFEIVGLLKPSSLSKYILGCPKINGKIKYARVVIKRKSAKRKSGKKE